MRYQPGGQQVIVEHGKHGEYYYAASTPEEFAASCYDILKTRWESGYFWQEDLKPEPEGLLTPEQIEALPDGAVKDLAIRERKNHEYRNRSAIEINAMYDEVKRIVEAKDITMRPRTNRRTGNVMFYECAASNILEQRSDHEYERVELETLAIPSLLKEKANAN